MSNRLMLSRIGSAVLFLLFVATATATPARAARVLLTESAVPSNGNPNMPVPPPVGEFEGACGLAIGATGQVFVSDYYHRVVDTYSAVSGSYLSQRPAGASPVGPCGLALDSSGALYVNYYHQSVVRLMPSEKVFDEGNSTGVVVGPNRNVYVDDGTYIAVYQSSGAPVLSEGAPLRIGVGDQHEYFGLAFNSGRVYVADASDDTIKVFQPATDPQVPSAVIDGSATPGGQFRSLADTALAVDPTNGHLLVLDNLQPFYEHPQAAIDEFDSTGTFLGRLTSTVISGEPSGLAVDPASGTLLVTSGNSEGSSVFAFGPYSAGSQGLTSIPSMLSQSATAADTQAHSAATAPPVGPSVAAGLSRRLHLHLHRRRAHTGRHHTAHRR